jgi:hypothetical protein
VVFTYNALHIITIGANPKGPGCSAPDLEKTKRGENLSKPYTSFPQHRSWRKSVPDRAPWARFATD